MLMKRVDYKAVKHMDKQQLTEYLQRIYRRGYEAGVKSLATQIQKSEPSQPDGASEKSDSAE